ncbi:MAG: ribonuclease H family protein [Chloroflexota bacterium]
MAKKKQKKFYVVWKGRQTGVFEKWDDCKAQVDGFAGAEYKSFSSRVLAEAAFAESYEDYKGKDFSKVETLSEEERRRIGAPILRSYAVDAACSGVPGPVEYRCVDTQTGAEIFRRGPFPDGTNNIGEFLAIVHALAVCQQKKSKRPIYSDSKIAINWVRNKACRTKQMSTAKNEELFALIIRAEAWLAENEYANPIYKWETKAWGEIPADFGRK